MNGGDVLLPLQDQFQEEGSEGRQPLQRDQDEAAIFICATQPLPTIENAAIADFI
jgi:hypothetical protein